MSNAPSLIEIENTSKVLDLLAKIEGISFKNLREDIFEITGPEGAKCVLDVEETLICIGSEICELPEDESKQFLIFRQLMDLNNEAIHGKFTLCGNKIFFKENLEFENLDGNELEAALGWTIVMVIKGAERISLII